MDAIFPVLITGLSDSDSAVKVVAIQALAGLAKRASTHREAIVQGLTQCAASGNADVSKKAKAALVAAYKAEPEAGTTRRAD